MLTRNRYLKLFLIGLKSAPMDPFVIATHRLCHLASLFHSRLACSLECVLCYGKRLIGLLMAHRVSLSFSGHWEGESHSPSSAARRERGLLGFIQTGSEDQLLFVCVCVYLNQICVVLCSLYTNTESLTTYIIN